MSTISGYRAVTARGWTSLPRIFPMMVTAAGTICALRGCFVIGAGVAGLQAIAT